MTQRTEHWWAVLHPGGHIECEPSRSWMDADRKLRTMNSMDGRQIVRVEVRFDDGRKPPRTDWGGPKC